MQIACGRQRNHGNGMIVSSIPLPPFLCHGPMPNADQKPADRLPMAKESRQWNDVVKHSSAHIPLPWTDAQCPLHGQAKPEFGTL